VSLRIERGAGMADILALLEGDRTSAPKLNPQHVARLQSRSGLAWTWRRPDGKAVVCAGLMPIGEAANRRRFEAWFTCHPDLSLAELHDFLRFAQLTLRGVAHDGAHETVAYVQGGRSSGARIARLIGFGFDRSWAGLETWRWTSEVSDG
jgi:hypothetical protein